MSKRMLYCIAVLLALCLPGYAQGPERASRHQESKTRTETTIRRLPTMQTLPDRSDAKGELAPGMFMTQESTVMSTSKIRRQEIPMAPEGTVTTQKIYGDKIYPSGQGQKCRGLKRVRLDGTLANVLQSELRMSYKCIGVKDHYIYGFVWQKDDYGEVSGAWFRTYDLWTDEYTDVDLSQDFENTFIQGGVYVPEENAFYGFGYECWLKFDVATMKATKLASPVTSSYNPQMTYNTKLRKIVGITAQGDFYEYSKADGSQTLLKSTGVTSPYTAGLCYDILSNHYIWAPNTDSKSELIAFDATTFEPVKICDIEDISQLATLYCNESKPNDPEAPKKPELVSADFPSGALTGNVEFKLPELCNNESAITGEMDYTLFINGLEYTKGKGNAGANVVIPIGADAKLKDGFSTFNLVCFLGSHESLDSNAQIYVGNDTPVKPKNVKLTIDEVSWDAVTAGVHNGYVDLDKIRYTVEINGKKIAENITELKCPAGLNPDNELAAYTATVYATANGMTSEGGTSNDITFGSAFAEPVYLQPTAQEAKLFTIVNSNDDRGLWQYHDISGAYRYKYDFRHDGDDWLFLPPVKITNTEYLHNFSFNAWSADEEVFEVYVGKEPTAEAMTQMVIDKTTTTGDEVPTRYEGMFDISEAGEYYIGIHAITPKDRLFLYAKDMRIDVASVSKEGPAAVTDLTATPAAEGGLSATLTFKMPTTNIKGAPITDAVTVKIVSDTETKNVTGAPGSEQTVTISTNQGDNHLTLQTFLGENSGITTDLDVYTGVDKPGMPKNLRADMGANNIQGKLRWEAPTTGQNGRYIRSTGIKYYLCQKEITIMGTTEWSIVQEIGTDVFEFGFRLAENTPQQLMSLGVAAENEAGVGNVVAITEFSVGKPHTIPAKETFDKSDILVYKPMTLKSSGESKVNWHTGDPAELGEKYTASDKGAICGTTASDTYGIITLPKFCTSDKHEVAFIPNIFLGECKNIRITATANGVEETEVYNLSNVSDTETPTGYNDIEVKLPEAFQNKGWVEMKVYVYFSTDQSFFAMDGYRMKNLLDQDLSVDLTTMARGFVGQTMPFKATVTNIGVSDCQFSGGKFTLTDDKNNLIAESTVDEAQNVSADSSIEIVWDYIPALKDLGSCIAKFELLGSDMDASNDICTQATEIAKGKAVVVDDLNAVLDSDGIALEWTAPEVRNGLESFEDYKPFITDGDHIGDFTNIWDENVSAYVVTIDNKVDEIFDNVAYKTGFHVYNSETLNAVLGRGVMPYAVDGEQLLIAFCPSSQNGMDAPSANDWLISPLVKGGTSFSFSGSPVSGSYGKETVEICYTTEDTVDPEKFELLQRVEIGPDNTSSPVEWQNFSVTLPENAKRVALHYISRDVFGVCIDNIKYIPTAGELSVTGYKVFHADDKAADFAEIGQSSICSYTDKTSDSMLMNRYYVVPTLSDGSMGVESNIVSITSLSVDQLFGQKSITGGVNEIVILGYDGGKANVYTADGCLIESGTCSDITKIEVAAGLYIVTVGNDTVKVMVR